MQLSKFWMDWFSIACLFVVQSCNMGNSLNVPGLWILHLWYGIRLLLKSLAHTRILDLCSGYLPLRIHVKICVLQRAATSLENCQKRGSACLMLVVICLNIPSSLTKLEFSGYPSLEKWRFSSVTMACLLILGSISLSASPSPRESVHSSYINHHSMLLPHITVLFVNYTFIKLKKKKTLFPNPRIKNRVFRPFQPELW